LGRTRLAEPVSSWRFGACRRACRASGIHGFVADRRVHAATGVGFALAVITIPLILGLGASEAWAALLENVLGPPGSDASH